MRGNVILGIGLISDSITVPTCAPGPLTIDAWTAPPQTLGVFDLTLCHRRDAF